ncbi:hypothetical protein PEL8287_02447 [Roseovarius litorisediminis]|uniref:Tetratricopeptide repeat protein n=1 Tax=Roseovarius litorisediminis TaxID=1312363 RepID=A0A1Y5SVR7_9RHOB|nr:hypothetical protein [Roseovarius litorisediminis]SLN47699.1 hypothetical protein PEL8287_02447 [Roseovarius litorisediminis]
MRIQFECRSLTVFGLVFALAACEPGVVSKGSSFQRNYSIARKALETGNYDMAIKGYGAMIPEAGPFEPRLRLEYAHALLRAGRFDEASSVSGALAQTLKGSDRAAALAVKGAAEHEKAILAMNNGDFGSGTANSLHAASSAIDEMLKIDPEMDPMGAMASRRSDIREELSRVNKSG